jgi:hypothetical protein
MTPIKQHNNRTQEERNYNKIHSSTRVVVEKAFGRLKSRWRILTGQGIFCRSLNRIILIIYVSCILHNICINNLDTWNDIVTDLDSDDDDFNAYELNDRQEENLGKQRRLEIIQGLR